MIQELGKQLLEFTQSKERNRWFETNEIKIYVRNGHHVVDTKIVDTFDIATVEATELGQKVFTHLLEYIESRIPKTLYVENVLEERFQQFFERRGYIKIEPATDPPCYYKE